MQDKAITNMITSEIDPELVQEILMTQTLEMNTKRK